MGELSLRRYEIGRVLGRGGTGTVYEALDTRTRAMVALKTVESSIAESVYRLKHEFRVLHDVEHRNLVHFGELACEGDTWFFTMELISGCSFIDHVRPRVTAPGVTDSAGSDDSEDDDGVTMVVRALQDPARTDDVAASNSDVGPILDEARLRAALAQLVEALSVLHRAGHVHRDVKPGNVLVAHDGRVVLLDFGLVFALAGGVPTDTTGTLGYMAPEQLVEGVAVGPAADWYAVGVMLFLALTGQLPFRGERRAIERKVYDPAPAPHDLVAGLPADLDQLCIELLERSPRRRPREDRIRARLGLPARRARSAGETAAPPFVGRGPELARLTAAIEDVRRGHARAVIVEGDSGIGKSALVQRFLATVGPEPLILAGRCYPQETVPFNGVDSIVDELSERLRRWPDAAVTPLRAGGVRYLATVFPVLGRVPSIAAATAHGRGAVDQASLRELAFGEAARLFAALARERPLIVFLDDLQWLDADGLALLARSVLPSSGTPCLFLATRRRQPGTAAIAGAELVELGPLSEDDAIALWGALRPDGDDARALAVREAAGHPLFLAELARAEPGTIEGAALLDVLRARIRAQPSLERRFLEAAAIAVAPTPYEVVARAAELDVGECLTRIRTLKAAQLLRITRDGEHQSVHPYHDRIRDAILAELGDDPERVPRLHLQLGRALLDATPAPALRDRVFAIVQHLDAARALLAGDTERARVAELALLASREARLATAYPRARELARIGLELTGNWQAHYPLCRDLHVAQLEAAFLAGDRAAAHQLFEAARPRLTAIDDVVALWEAWIELETGAGRLGDAIAAGRAGLAVLGLALPERLDDPLIGRELEAVERVIGGRSLAALEALPALEDPTQRGVLQLLMAIGPVAFFLDTRLVTWIHLRVVADTLRHGLCAAAGFGFAGHGMTLAALGRPEEAAGLAELALRVNQRFGNPRLAARLHLKLGAFVLHWARPFAEAKATLRTAHQLALEHGDAAYEVYAATFLSIMTFCEAARLADIAETGAWAHQMGARRDDRDMAAVPAIHMWYAATLADGTAADPASIAGLPALTEATTPVAMFHLRICSAMLAYLAGDWRRAGALLADAERRPGGSAANPITVEVSLLGALVAARAHDHADEVERDALEAELARRAARLAGWAGASPTNYLAHARLAAAELARIRGRDDEAALAYREAIAAARDHGAPRCEALALELAAAHQRDHDPRRADELLGDAAAVYRRWGAHARADALSGVSAPVAAGPGSIVPS